MRQFQCKNNHIIFELKYWVIGYILLCKNDVFSIKIQLMLTHLFQNNYNNGRYLTFINLKNTGYKRKFAT